MSDASLDRANLSARTSGNQTVLYRFIFSVLFIFSVGTIALSRLTQNGSKYSIWNEAKQAAHATAGYAVKY